MSENTLSNKYRPKSLEEVAGQSDVVIGLTAELNSPNRGHTYLFYGPRGTGKTTTALIMKDQLKCGEMDFVHLDAANTRGIDTVREIINQTNYGPVSGEARLFLLDECHQLTPQAQEALLKTTESSPTYCFFVLSTTEPEKLIATLRSRCSTYRFNSITKRALVSLIVSVMSKEGYSPEERQVFNDVIWKVAMLANGSAREALILLGQCLAIGNSEKALSFLDNYVPASESDIRELCQKLLSPGPWSEIATILDNLKGEPEQIRRSVFGYLGAVLRRTGDQRVADRMVFFRTPFYDVGKHGLTLACFFAKTKVK